MPLIRTVQIGPGTRLGVWHIAEEERFFLERVSISREIHHPHKRLQHLAGRYLLVTLFPDFPINDIRRMNSRKPYLHCNSYYFSISHCGDYAAAIVSSSSPVGIDIEQVKEKIDWVSHKFLSVDELAYMDPAHDLPHKSICWSAKEAVYKWFGLGGIDFRANIRLAPFRFQPAGFITCNFVKEDIDTQLYLQYILENELCLAWVLPGTGT
ncbi:4'-phosphopantetheinyl transferase superfamily protein [Chitinophaga pendula]|uniref:4'-phosphopantetheinyl transferase family protein n=1 Tax=Chitinophaga TaxID=79328 RepID=UPI000BAF4A71|nr:MULTISPECIES: 4'-phosphopantetheinyl transferase superfamily protein [Chitinophaga]ASZ14027.1 4-phosphopantetheinyl transferase [Chitinophaga sp. MD30]UCJ08344.1 4'-phosphopantetheinyl transferase superfamily protein [Chitinophaga pendula]